MPRNDTEQDAYLRSWFERNRTRQDGELTIDGVTVLVRRGVFSPDPTLTNATSQMIRHLPDVSDARVLDIGTGSGILALIAARRGASAVVAVDLDAAAVANAAENVERHALGDRVTVLQGDLFEPVEGRFDVVTAALPILDAAWIDLGITIEDVFRRFFEGLDTHLTPHGAAIFCFASFGDRAGLRRAMAHTTRSWQRFEERRFGVCWEVYRTGL